MACLQLLKSSPSNSQAKFGCFCSEFNSKAPIRRSIRLRNSGIMFRVRLKTITMEAKEGKFDKSMFVDDFFVPRELGYDEEPPESLFMKELRRRGMTPTSLLDEKNRRVDKDEEVKFREEDGGWSYSTRNRVSMDAEINLSNQRETSMALNSEGLEGFIPRAKLLLTLGGTFFLAFWPWILAAVASFAALYLYFGPQFVHDGSTTPVASPPYVDPYALLEEQKIYRAAPLLN